VAQAGVTRVARASSKGDAAVPPKPDIPPPAGVSPASPEAEEVRALRERREKLHIRRSSAGTNLIHEPPLPPPLPDPAEEALKRWEQDRGKAKEKRGPSRRKPGAGPEKPVEEDNKAMRGEKQLDLLAAVAALNNMSAPAAADLDTLRESFAAYSTPASEVSDLSELLRRAEGASNRGEPAPADFLLDLSKSAAAVELPTAKKSEDGKPEAKAPLEQPETIKSARGKAAEEDRQRLEALKQAAEKRKSQDATADKRKSHDPASKPPPTAVPVKEEPSTKAEKRKSQNAGSKPSAAAAKEEGKIVKLTTPLRVESRERMSLVGGTPSPGPGGVIVTSSTRVTPLPTPSPQPTLTESEDTVMLSFSAGSVTSSPAPPSPALSASLLPAPAQLQVVLPNGTRKPVQIHSTLIFDDVLRMLAKEKANQYELQNEGGGCLAGLVASHFAGQKEALCYLRKSDLDL
jgi:hypothetical protein